MKSNIRRLLLAVAVSLVTLPGIVKAEEDAAKPVDLVTNGDFEAQALRNGLPGWEVPFFGRSSTLEKDGDNQFLRMRKTDMEQSLRAVQKVQLQPESRTLKISARLRVSELNRGKPWYHSAGIRFDFFKDKDRLPFDNPGARKLMPTGDTDWTPIEISVDVPEGATMLELKPGIFNSISVLDVDDVKVVVENK